MIISGWFSEMKENQILSGADIERVSLPGPGSPSVCENDSSNVFATYLSLSGTNYIIDNIQ